MWKVKSEIMRHVFCLFALILAGAMVFEPLTSLFHSLMRQDYHSLIPCIPFISGYLIYLKKNDLELKKIDYVIFHQANNFMLEHLRKKVKIPKEKFYNNLEETGNTVSATIPIALRDCMDQQIIKEGDRILLVGFGVGYSWGATIIEI